MIKGLEALKMIENELKFFYHDDWDITRYPKDITIIEKELKDYQEIKEIAKYFNWDNITSEVFNVKTDKKYRDLFNSAIINIQEDYRKARALEIIKRKVVLVDVLVESENANDYNEFVSKSIDRHLTQGEYDLLKEVLL